VDVGNHSAPGIAAAFSFQFERALFWLSHSPAGFKVGIETADDVAIQGDSEWVYEQDKHSIREGAIPFGDRSKDLWNTLAIWLEAINKGDSAIEKSAFLMVTNKAVPACIARQISAARDPSELEDCVAALERAATEPPDAIKVLVKKVLDPSSRTSLLEIIRKTRLVDSSMASAGTELRQKTIGHLQLPQWCGPSADSIVDELHGWMHRIALDSWRKNTPAWLERDHFVNQLHTIIDRRRREVRRERAEHLVPVDDASVGKQKGRPFVKQLHLVTDDGTVVDTAIREFIRCNIEKGRLSSEGNISDEDWVAFEGNLLSRWKKINARLIRLGGGLSERDVGFQIFVETTEQHRERLAGNDTEQVYLTSGSYHRLADISEVGWHPRFKVLMTKDAV